MRRAGWLLALATLVWLVHAVAMTAVPAPAPGVDVSDMGHRTLERPYASVRP